MTAACVACGEPTGDILGGQYKHSTRDGCIAALRARVERVEEALKRASRFMDFEMRAWLPNEHLNCAIDSGCSHGAAERAMFDALENAVMDASLSQIEHAESCGFAMYGAPALCMCAALLQPTPAAP